MRQLRNGKMAGRTVLVTGATNGIGRATALGLATRGAHLAITGRDRRRTEDAADEIRAAGGRPVDVFVADLSSQSELRRLVDEVLHSLLRIDVLVNNVGGYWNTRHITADGLERTFALNHLAPFLLTNLLLDRLKHSAPARVVTVASNVHARGESTSTTCRANGPTPVHAPTTSPSSPTCCSPMNWPGSCRPPPSPPTPCIPAWFAPSFGAEDPAAGQRLFTPLLRPFMKSPANGATTSIHLASAPDLEQVTGRYFANSTPKISAKPSYDAATATQLWQVSAELVGLTTLG